MRPLLLRRAASAGTLYVKVSEPETRDMEIQSATSCETSSSCGSDVEDDAKLQPEQLQKMVQNTFAGAVDHQQQSLQKLTPRARTKRLTTLKVADTPSLILLANLAHENAVPREKSLQETMRESRENLTEKTFRNARDALRTMAESRKIKRTVAQHWRHTASLMKSVMWVRREMRKVHESCVARRAAEQSMIDELNTPTNPSLLENMLYEGFRLAIAGDPPRMIGSLTRADVNRAAKEAKVEEMTVAVKYYRVLRTKAAAEANVQLALAHTNPIAARKLLLEHEDHYQSYLIRNMKHVPQSTRTLRRKLAKTIPPEEVPLSPVSKREAVLKMIGIDPVKHSHSHSHGHSRSHSHSHSHHAHRSREEPDNDLSHSANFATSVATEWPAIEEFLTVLACVDYPPTGISAEIIEEGNEEGSDAPTPLIIPPTPDFTVDSREEERLGVDGQHVPRTTESGETWGTPPGSSQSARVRIVEKQDEEVAGETDMETLSSSRRISIGENSDEIIAEPPAEPVEPEVEIEPAEAQNVEVGIAFDDTSKYIIEMDPELSEIEQESRWVELEAQEVDHESAKSQPSPRFSVLVKFDRDTPIVQLQNSVAVFSEEKLLSSSRSFKHGPPGGLPMVKLEDEGYGKTLAKNTMFIPPKTRKKIQTSTAGLGEGVGVVMADNLRRLIEKSGGEEGETDSGSVGAWLRRVNPVETEKEVNAELPVRTARPTTRGATYRPSTVPIRPMCYTVMSVSSVDGKVRLHYVEGTRSELLVEADWSEVSLTSLSSDAGPTIPSMQNKGHHLASLRWDEFRQLVQLKRVEFSRGAASIAAAIKMPPTHCFLPSRPDFARIVRTAHMRVSTAEKKESSIRTLSAVLSAVCTTIVSSKQLADSALLRRTPRTVSTAILRSSPKELVMTPLPPTRAIRTAAFSTRPSPTVAIPAETLSPLKWEETYDPARLQYDEIQLVKPPTAEALTPRPPPTPRQATTPRQISLVSPKKLFMDSPKTPASPLFPKVEAKHDSSSSPVPMPKLTFLTDNWIIKNAFQIRKSRESKIWSSDPVNAKPVRRSPAGKSAQALRWGHSELNPNWGLPLPTNSLRIQTASGSQSARVNKND